MNITLAFFRDMFRGEQLKPTVVILYTVIAASLWKILHLFGPNLEALSRFARTYLGKTSLTIDFCLGSYKILAAFILFAVIPALIVKYLFRERLRDYGVSLGYKVRTLRSFLIMCPLLFLVGMYSGQQKEFLTVYPLNEFIQTNSPHSGLFALHALTYLLYYLGWEFLFRGFLQHGLSQQCGIHTAVCIQILATTMLHYGNPGSEVIASIAAGLYWGFLVLRTRSLLSGFLQHALLGITLDYFLVFSQ